MSSYSPVPIAEVVRSGFVEGRHYGSTVAVGPDGAVLDARGDVESPILPRSCNKPLQAVGMLRAGLDLDGEQLALACASHSGEDFHLAVVRRILAEAGFGEDDLRCPPAYPLDDEVRDQLIRRGGERSRILMDCSGKHAAMLATCVRNGWDTTSYLEVEHPLQQAIARTFAELTGQPIDVVAVDGCGAPLLSTSLTGLARAFSRLATATDGPELRVAEAIRHHPAYVSGSNRDELTLIRAVPGSLGKAGAESCYVFALADGRAFALKTDDGAARARPVVMAALLERLGVTSEEGVDAGAVRRTGAAPLLGGDEVVGEIRATAP